LVLSVLVIIAYIICRNLENEMFGREKSDPVRIVKLRLQQSQR
jgi:hypothetical protein